MSARKLEKGGNTGFDNELEMRRLVGGQADRLTEQLECTYNSP